MKRLRSTLDSIPDWLLVLLGLGALVWLIWLPFGWHTTGTYEEWSLFFRANFGDSLIFPGLANRPLLSLPYFLGHVLTPGSFVGLNLVQALFIVLRGWLAYVFMRELAPRRAGFAFLTGALFMIFPADVGLFSLRTPSTHGAVWMLLLSLILLLNVAERPRWPILLGMVAAEAVSLSLYENGIPLMLVSPLLIWLRPPRRFTRWRLILTLIWLVAPFISLVAEFISIRSPGTYQSMIYSLSGVTQKATPDLIGALIASLGNAYAQNLIGGWLATVQLMTLTPLYGALATAAALVVSACLWRIMRRDAAPLTFKALLGWFALGLVVIGSGFVFYLPTNYRDSNFRVFFYSSFGGALCCAALLSWLARRRTARVLVAAVLVWLATLHGLFQFQVFAGASRHQQSTLAQIVAQAPRLKPGAILIILDKTPYLTSQAWDWCGTPDQCLSYALNYLYDDATLGALICGVDYFPRGAASNHCVFAKDGFHITYQPPGSEPIHWHFNTDQLVVFESSERGLWLLRDLTPYQTDPPTDHAYNPLSLVDPGASLPPRVSRFFARWPFEDQTP